MKLPVVALQHRLHCTRIVLVDSSEELASSPGAVLRRWSVSRRGCWRGPRFLQYAERVDHSRKTAEQDGLQQKFLKVAARDRVFARADEARRELLPTSWPDHGLSTNKNAFSGGQAWACQQLVQVHGIMEPRTLRRSQQQGPVWVTAAR